MKKSNKLSVVYIITSTSLLLVLLFGGVYGVYISVGLNFIKSSVSNVTNVTSRASNVSYAGNVNNGVSSMTGVIVLSIALIVLAIFDIVSLIKQIVFFKQFKFVKDSNIEHMVERKVKSKGSVVFLACLVDVLSLVVGVAGIFVNARSFVGNNVSWILYVVDGGVCVLAIVSFVLLLMKLKKVKKQQQEAETIKIKNAQNRENENRCDIDFHISNFDIDKIEYCLIKLKYLKSSKIISNDEYNLLRDSLFNKKRDEVKFELNQKK